STSRSSPARTTDARRPVRRSCGRAGSRAWWRRSATRIRASAAAALGGGAAAHSARLLAAPRRGRPFVLLKAALTLDGRIATASGESKWITSRAQRREARWLRRLHHGVGGGIGNALADHAR